MTAKDKTTLAGYTRACADKMGLRNWTFDLIFSDEDLDPNHDHVNDDDEHEQCAGEIIPVIGQRHATIRLSPSLRTGKRDECRHIVVHELVHCHFTRLRELVRTGLVAHLGAQGYSLFMHGFDLEWEHSIDAIAVSWAQSLPLIDWREERRGEREGKKAS